MTFLPHVAVMFLSGLTGSLHCIGMCGPILVGLGQWIEGGTTVRSSSRRLADLGCYHVGRIWTYALLGLFAGQLGALAQSSGAYLGWQRPFSVVVASLIIVAGVLLLGILPVRLDSGRAGCWFQRLRMSSLFRTLTTGSGLAPRLLLGVIMGFLPCGLIYAMLVLAAATGSPTRGALGMVAFGLGTLPSLGLVQLGAARLPAWIRARGTRVAAVTIVVTGLWMLSRAVFVDATSTGCPGCVATDR